MDGISSSLSCLAFLFLYCFFFSFRSSRMNSDAFTVTFFFMCCIGRINSKRQLHCLQALMQLTAYWNRVIRLKTWSTVVCAPGVAMVARLRTETLQHDNLKSTIRPRFAINSYELFIDLLFRKLFSSFVSHPHRFIVSLLGSLCFF